MKARGLPRWMRAGALSLMATAAVILAACAPATTAPDPSATQPSPATAVLTTPSPEASGEAGTEPIVAVVERVTPAVVTVTSRLSSSNAFFEPSTRTGVGTGFIVRPDGVVLTNHHVIENAQDITVTLADGRTFEARVAVTDEDHDLAILQIDARDLPVLALGDSSQVTVGEHVIAVGFALGLEGGPTVTSGIISSLERTIQVQDSNGPGSIRTYRDVLQTDAAINPGNSGGPLVDLAGNVVGINTAGARSAENVGFAITVDTAKALIERVLGS